MRLEQNDILKYIPVETDRNLKDAISTIEITETRQIISQLNQLTDQTRFELNYDVSALSSILKQENVECIKHSKESKKKKKEKRKKNPR